MSGPNCIEFALVPESEAETPAMREAREAALSKPQSEAGSTTNPTVAFLLEVGVYCVAIGCFIIGFGAQLGLQLQLQLGSQLEESWVISWRVYREHPFWKEVPQLVRQAGINTRKSTYGRLAEQAREESILQSSFLLVEDLNRLLGSNFFHKHRSGVKYRKHTNSRFGIVAVQKLFEYDLVNDDMFGSGESIRPERHELEFDQLVQQPEKPPEDWYTRYTWTPFSSPRP
ncbi:hypothetical protein C8R47DRAFT_1068937 [Mycena vitilis]|nr:hypothetical protein C8R47DRAFT_1068937 [Mycena vitilis]